MSDLFRVGNHQPINIYRGDEYVGVMFAGPELAAEVVAAMNDRTAGDSGRLADLQEKADVRRRIDERAEHRPSSLGDGLGYGPCVGCGELWPCKASRAERASA